MISPLATPIARMRATVARPVPVFGVCLHTTGSGLPEEAAKLGLDPLVHAEHVYSSMEFWPHYVIHGRRILAVCAEEIRAQHVGRFVPDGHGAQIDRREQYMSGEWLQLMPAHVVELWRKAWPGRAHPYSLFPSQSPNGDYVGIEIIPIHPSPAGLRFTDDDHETAAQLCVDIGRRHGLPKGWWNTSRLVGHEDVGLIDRHDKLGGWDPGFLRDVPYFDMPRVRARVGELAAAGL